MALACTCMWVVSVFCFSPSKVLRAWHRLPERAAFRLNSAFDFRVLRAKAKAQGEGRRMADDTPHIRGALGAAAHHCESDH
jgi:hypothetical protein